MFDVYIEYTSRVLKRNQNSKFQIAYKFWTLKLIGLDRSISINRIENTVQSALVME